MRYTIHTFRPTETIDAVIRLKGHYSYTPDEMAILRNTFNQLNGMVVPRPGQTFKIPLPFTAVDDFGEVVEVSSTQYMPIVDIGEAINTPDA